MSEAPGVVEMIIQMLQSKRGTPEAQAASQGGAEAVNAALPEEVSARPAVLQKREQLRQLDGMLNDDPAVMAELLKRR